MSAIGFSKGCLLPAANHANIVCVQFVCRGVIGIKIRSLFILSLSFGKISVVFHFDLAKNGMGMS